MQNMYLKGKIDSCITVELPKAVSSYITKGNFDNVTCIQKNLIADYKKDNSTLEEDFFLRTKSRVGTGRGESLEQQLQDAENSD